MYICVCKKVPEIDVKRMIESGMTIRQIAKLLGAGSKCGACVTHLKANYREEKKDGLE
jgi:bacterioferritin-associated ferredoxin